MSPPLAHCVPTACPFSRESDLNTSTNHRPTILVDADACPTAIKDLVFRTAQRREIHAVLVANQAVSIPDSQWIRRVTVRSGADKADHAIVEFLRCGDVVVADDIPLAARVVQKGGIVIGSRGERYDEKNVHQRLAARDLMEQLRLAGIESKGMSPLTPKDIQAFANQLDRTLTKLIGCLGGSRSGGP